ncbi:MAG: PQQ-binding-like beta-propeller repeat protein [Alphaproteobacteria bacterium]|nr:PQQ-binding-like beta-propeller repeat protein [Alphaproteobacteria bacterium]
MTLSFSRRSFALALVLSFSLAGCEWMQDTWMGGDDKKPLPGKRVSVLAHDSKLKADPEAAEQELRLPAPEANDAWPQAGGYSTHAMHHMLVSANPKRAWTAGIGAGSSDYRRLLTPPVIFAGRVFAMDVKSRVSAHDEKSGKRLWRIDLTPDEEDGDDLMGGGLAVDGGRLFATTSFGHIVALDPANGKALWRTKLVASLRAAPTARAGRLFVVTMDNQTHALDQATGKTLWTHTGINEGASILGSTSPAADDTLVIVPYSSGELTALRSENGTVLWSDSLSSGRRTDAISGLSDIRGRPIIDRGRVFAIGHGDLMVAIDLRSGRRIWEAEVGGVQSPWVAGEYLYTITNEAEVICVEAKSGRIRWVTPLQRWKNAEKKKDPIVWAGPVLASDRLIVTSSSGMAVSLSPYTGKPQGLAEMPDGVSLPPIVANKELLFLTDEADLVVYR